MSVEQILRAKGSNVVTVAPEATLAEVATTLMSESIGAAVVSADALSVEGIVSERDIVRAIALNGASALDLQARQVMTPDVITCSPAESVESLMQIMTSGRFRHVPVLVDQRLVGIISIGDIVKRRIEDVETEAEHLREYITS